MRTINLSNFGLQGVASLSRDEMKKVSGGASGGGCCVHNGGGQRKCGYGRDEAEEVADQLAYEYDRQMYWCYDSC